MNALDKRRVEKAARKAGWSRVWENSMDFSHRVSHPGEFSHRNNVGTLKTFDRSKGEIAARRYLGEIARRSKA